MMLVCKIAFQPMSVNYDLMSTPSTTNQTTIIYINNFVGNFNGFSDRNENYD